MSASYDHDLAVLERARELMAAADEALERANECGRLADASLERSEAMLADVEREQAVGVRWTEKAVKHREAAERLLAEAAVLNAAVAARVETRNQELEES